MKNLKIIGVQIYNFDKLASDIPIGSKGFGTNSIIHRVFKHRVDEEDRRREWRNVFSSKFHEHRRFPSTDRYFEKRSRRKPGCRLVDPPLFWIYIYTKLTLRHCTKLAPFVPPYDVSTAAVLPSLFSDQSL